VKDIRHFIGLSCDGFEGQFMALFTAIKASHNQEGWVSNSKTAFRSNRELKRLSCSINYDSTGGNSSRSRVKGRELMSYSFVLNLWGCSHVEWCCLDSTTLIASCAWYTKNDSEGAYRSQFLTTFNMISSSGENLKSKPMGINYIFR
jgi:hypothetical protein